MQKDVICWVKTRLITWSICQSYLYLIPNIIFAYRLLSWSVPPWIHSVFRLALAHRKSLCLCKQNTVYGNTALKFSPILHDCANLQKKNLWSHMLSSLNHEIISPSCVAEIKYEFLYVRPTNVTRGRRTGW